MSEVYVEGDYVEEIAERESEHYSPYDYVEDRDDPILFDEEILSEWEW